MSAGGDGFDIRTLAETYHAGMTLAAHRHRWGQLVFANSGVMRVMTEAAAWLVPPTRAIWLPAGVQHVIAVQGEVAMRSLYIDAPRAAPLPEAPRMSEVAPLLRKLILHILTIGMLAPEHPEHHRIAGLLIDLMLAVRHEDLMLPLPRDARAMRLAERWRQIPGDSQDLAALAMEVGASLRTLRLFPNETGLTIEEWRQKARMIHAIGRLAAGVSVTDTALHCGYPSPAAFTRQFGVSPGRYQV